MVKQYPVVVWTEKGKRKVYIPDFDVEADGLRAAKDLIGFKWLELEEKGETMPVPSSVESVSEQYPKKKIERVQVVYEKYIEKNEQRKIQEKIQEHYRNLDLSGPSQEEKGACDAVVRRLFEKYYTKKNINLLKERIKKKDEYTVQHSRGGEYLLNGFYSRSLLTETIVSNVTRGKLLTRLTGKAPDYTYYFDTDGKLMLVCQSPGTEWEKYTLVERDGKCEFTIGDFRAGNKNFDIVRIGETHFKNGKNLEHAEFWFSPGMDKIKDGFPEGYELKCEKYEYGQGENLLGGTMKTCRTFGRKERYFIHHYSSHFVYDESGRLMGSYLGDSCEELFLIPPQLKEIITDGNEKSKSK